MTSTEQLHAEEQPPANPPLAPPAPIEQPADCTTTTTTATEAVEAPEVPLSKNARKRALKEAKWAAGKEQRDEERRKKRKLTKEHRKEKMQQGLIQTRPRFAKDQIASKVGIIIDLDFEGKMKSQEVRSTAQQVSRCYSINKHSSICAQLHLSTFIGTIKDAVASTDPNYLRWEASKCPARFHEGDFTTVVENKDDIVYLTADSPDTLTELEEGKFYVIGGLVDKNRHKFLCYERAKELGIKTAKLPISEYLSMQTRQVLTINHVFEIMVKYLETKDWQQSFLAVMPQRKKVTAKVPAAGGEGERDEEEEDDEERRQDVEDDLVEVGKNNGGDDDDATEEKHEDSDYLTEKQHQNGEDDHEGKEA
ncbi:hypothetical protein PhCBS80983_g05260 [Powellomyces hirtus]|uniref:tRNA (guanine(9)-N1)-methyltransferase n=1 Tax=Powellomyces hirtus TaxID=109895 RepID=A0A507DUS8_9FUNG|nr:hypothetical protein PhCBS80983_g05260 [Powellomyces hirtus]